MQYHNCNKMQQGWVASLYSVVLFCPWNVKNKVELNREVFIKIWKVHEIIAVGGHYSFFFNFKWTIIHNLKQISNIRWTSVSSLVYDCKKIGSSCHHSENTVQKICTIKIMNIPTALFLQTCDTILQSNKTVQCIFKRRQECRKKNQEWRKVKWMKWHRVNTLRSFGCWILK